MVLTEPHDEAGSDQGTDLKSCEAINTVPCALGKECEGLQAEIEDCDIKEEELSSE